MFTVTPSSDPGKVTSATGSLAEDTTSGTQGYFTTAVLIVSGTCFAAAPVSPSEGFSTLTSLSINSLPTNGQFLSLTTTIGSSGAAMSGTFQIGGGCGDGLHGTITGTRLPVLNGSYAGSLTGAGSPSATLSLAQSSFPAGDGTFGLSGSAAFTGFSCFTKGTAQGGPASNITGPHVTATFVTNESVPSTIQFSGATLDATGKTLTAATYNVSGGACAGQSGTGTLTLQ